MNWDFFNGFWVGAFSLIGVELLLIWLVDENDDDSDDDDYHYEPIDDDHNHFQTA